MRRAIGTALSLFFLLAATVAQAQLMRWSSIHPTAAGALDALRQTDHWLAETMGHGFDDAGRLGRRIDGRRPLNFDAAHHLAYLVTDLNQDGREEVFLLIEWSAVTGNGPSPGVLMQKIGSGAAERWRIACEFEDWGRPGIVLVDRRSHGWRHFRLGSGTYGWRRSSEGHGAMDCVALTQTPQ